jgi:hypothetical protein
MGLGLGLGPIDNRIFLLLYVCLLSQHAANTSNPTYVFRDIHRLLPEQLPVNSRYCIAPFPGSCYMGKIMTYKNISEKMFEAVNSDTLLPS